MEDLLARLEAQYRTSTPIMETAAVYPPLDLRRQRIQGGRSSDTCRGDAGPVAAQARIIGADVLAVGDLRVGIVRLAPVFAARPRRVECLVVGVAREQTGVLDLKCRSACGPFRSGRHVSTGPTGAISHRQ
jgi:hypothetical protein